MAGGFKGSMVSVSLSVPLSVSLSWRREDSPVPGKEPSEDSAGAQAKSAVVSRGHKRAQRIRFTKESGVFIGGYLPYDFTSKYSIPKVRLKSKMKMIFRFTSYINMLTFSPDDGKIRCKRNFGGRICRSTVFRN
jgi:hypothetical protein